YRACRFGLITALDVLEHIEDDVQAVDDMLAMLAPGGFLFITVPAFQQLWDRHDEINRHYRRYTVPTLRRLLSGRGEIVSCRYLFHSLFFLKGLAKWLNSRGNYRVTQHDIPSRPLNWLMARWCVAEYHGLRGLRIPLGSSVVAVVRKTSPL